jgi:hypothetical protein
MLERQYCVVTYHCKSPIKPLLNMHALCALLQKGNQLCWLAKKSMLRWTSWYHFTYQLYSPIRPTWEVNAQFSQVMNNCVQFHARCSYCSYHNFGSRPNIHYSCCFQYYNCLHIVPKNIGIENEGCHHDTFDNQQRLTSILAWTLAATGIVSNIESSHISGCSDLINGTMKQGMHKVCLIMHQNIAWDLLSDLPYW